MFVRNQEWILHCDGYRSDTFEKCAVYFSLGFDTSMDAVAESAQGLGWSVGHFSAYCPNHRSMP